jgi:Ser/Thr protein kinase RdoA (MazF antagonist)
VLRVHRPGYHDRAAIESELAWVAALRADGVVRTATVVPARDGSSVVAGRAHPDAAARWCVLVDWLPGEHPREDRLEPAAFERLGSLAAAMHRHARRWRRPAWFTRPRWDWAGCLGPDGNWGRWQDAPGVGPAEREVLGRAADALRSRLAAFGDGPDRFGLVHADMRLANLLVHDGSVSVIDFDDCGFGWYMYDLGSSLSFIEHYPTVPQMIDSWVRGYRSQAPLSADEEAELPTFVMLRRLLLVAWIGSHADTDLAQDMGEEYTRASCDLAEDYLART